MPPKRKTAEPEPEPIKTELVVNAPIAWMPPADSPNTPIHQPSPDHGAQPQPSTSLTMQELREKFAAHFQGEIEAATDDKDDEQAKILSGVRAVALDPLSTLKGLDVARAPRQPLHKYFEELSGDDSAHAERLIGMWVNKTTETLNEVVKDKQTSTAKNCSSADRKA